MNWGIQGHRRPLGGHMGLVSACPTHAGTHMPLVPCPTSAPHGVPRGFSPEDSKSLHRAAISDLLGQCIGSQLYWAPMSVVLLRNRLEQEALLAPKELTI